MRLSSPSLIEIEDGEYARGKRIQVVRRAEVEREMRSVLEALRFLEKIQKPGDRLAFGCTVAQIEGNKMLYCGTFLEKQKIRRPREKLTVRCLAIPTEDGEAVVCETSLTDESERSY